MPPVRPSPNFERLINQLEVPPGRHLAIDGATLDMIRRLIKKLTTERAVPPRCLPLQADYTKKLQAANNALRGGGHPSNFDRIWNNFVDAALAFVDCVKEPEGTA